MTLALRQLAPSNPNCRASSLVFGCLQAGTFKALINGVKRASSRTSKQKRGLRFT
jgi:hypothetical protein